MAVGVSRVRPWVKDATAFLGFVLINAALLWLGLTLYRSWDRGEPEWVHWWLWAIAAPVWAAHSANQSELFWPLVWLNPLVYGAVWWFLWRMLRLIRTK